jgi:hypoxanthine phosphoribosyltransferase
MSSLRVLLTADQIQSRIQELGAQIDRDYPHGPVYLVGILKGACIFLSDLARAMNTPARLEFVGISSYGKGRSTSGEVKLTKDLDVSVEAQDVIVVEDIVDSGITLSYLIQVFRQRRPRSLRVATLLDKPERRQRPVTVDYAEDYRNLRDVCVLAE